MSEEKEEKCIICDLPCTGQGDCYGHQHPNEPHGCEACGRYICGEHTLVGGLCPECAYGEDEEDDDEDE